MKAILKFKATMKFFYEQKKKKIRLKTKEYLILLWKSLSFIRK